MHITIANIVVPVAAVFMICVPHNSLCLGACQGTNAAVHITTVIPVLHARIRSVAAWSTLTAGFYGAISDLRTHSHLDCPSHLTSERHNQAG